MSTYNLTLFNQPLSVMFFSSERLLCIRLLTESVIKKKVALDEDLSGFIDSGLNCANISKTAVDNQSLIKHNRNT